MISHFGQKKPNKSPDLFHYSGQNARLIQKDLRFWKTIGFDQLQVLGSMLITVPWISSDWSTDTVYIIIGVSLAILMIGKFVLVCMYKVHMFQEDLKKGLMIVRQYPKRL